LEKASGRKLFMQTGGLMIGSPDGVLVRGAKASADQHGLPYTLLSTSELRLRFSVFEPAEGMAALWEPRAGILFPEEAVGAHLELAARAGAELHYHEPIIRWEADGAGVQVHTHLRSLRARRLLLATGSWMSSCLSGLTLPLQVERQVLCWFEPRAQADRFARDCFPIFICEYEPSRFFYGFPDLGGGVKVAIHHQGQTVDPETVRRDVNEQDIEKMRTLIDRFLPSALGNLKSSAVCLYTNTPDEHFILDRHPQHPQVLLVSPCSGHGFKFSSVIGELAATMLSGHRPAFDLSLFRSNRF
jgi:sarcosine oxidase